jgi:hypothetical protein
MAGTRYIKKANGELAGSLPNGKVSPAAPHPTTMVVDSGPVVQRPSVDSLYDAFARKAEASPAAPAWLQGAPFPLVNAAVGEDYAFLTDYEISEDDRVRGDRGYSVAIKSERADLVLRAEKAEHDTGAPGVWRAVYIYPAYGEVNGARIATQVSRGDFTASYVSGTYTPEGGFVADPDGFHARLREQVGEPGCPLYGETDGYVDDWQVTTYKNDNYEISGLHIKATCEPVDLDDEDLVNPDSDWDSRFD